MKTTLQTTIGKTFLILLAAVALASCTKDDDINPDGNESGDLLLVEEKVNGQTLLTYEYDERNRAIVWTQYVNGEIHTIHSFTYDDSDRMIAQERKHNGQVFLKESYSYESGERPVSGVWTYIGNSGNVSTVSTVQYTYDQNTVTETVDIEDVGTIINSYVFDSKGNSIQHKIGQGVVDYGDFDGKSGVYERHPWSWKTLQINNYQSVKTTAAGMVISDHIYKYTYNDAGYPIKAEVYDRATNELIETREYTYKKAN